ncbi:unnamed protein product [Urochloa decumbens]|uniref:DUF1618 domain-containing protein n=1 Tax=Urochloa decumbens TaxID=240449 RepID=A0ABC9AMD4_9POAL
MAPPWVILGRVPRVAAAADEEPEDDAAPAFSLAVALPPRVSLLTAARSAHPDPTRPDKFPYVLAAGPDCLLSRFSVVPFYGARFGAAADLPEGHLVVARRFGTAAAAGEATAAAERVPDRPAAMPRIRSVEGVGLIAVGDGEGYVIAELQIERGSDRARLFRVHSGHGRWIETKLTNPLPARDREWVPGGVVSLQGRLWWFDLSWGILTCDLFIDGPDLMFYQLPGHRAMDVPALGNIHDSRCITACQGKLRYMEIMPQLSDLGFESVTVSMWTLNDVSWEKTYEERLEEIWNDNSYKKTWLPKEVPEIVLVCPSDPDLVYFSLEQRIFSVNVREHRALQFTSSATAHKLVNLPWPTSTSSRYVLAWELLHSAAEGLPVKKEKAHIDEEIHLYAKFCKKRAEALKGSNDYELCHMCFFEKGRFIPVKKLGMEDHCDRFHKTKGFLCEKTGCVVRAATLREAGLHHHYCHMQKSRDWWRPYLEEHGQA